ncbi:uncharacterized membrane protein (DUF485 family) [Planomicrobium koreense]|uniref:Uncharacterized membrane protein (DUF485 family) n=1 Tax=Planococcus koreensis TaxID=112331 RepID=A0A7W8CVM2_9BACL|nr:MULTISPECIES: DUF485 domain-containing protein [Planococcus]MBB5181323.1 uncharacterized membrane protein (DUF485 family) [Planococcus koreensis]MDN3448896.1 DUF485 domain-containing protein [Planococcus sp. APC 3906]
MAKTATGNNVSVPATGQDKAKIATNKREAGHIPDFEAIEASASFRELMKKKKAFLISTTVLFLGLYLLFNLVISYTDWLSAPFIGDISWVWVFAFGLFAMTWILVTVYMKRASKFDEMAHDTLKEFNYDEEENR